MVTKKTIRKTVERINRRLELANSPRRLQIDSAYGQYRIESGFGGNTSIRSLSPRMRTGRLAEWLDGFETAINEFYTLT